MGRRRRTFRLFPLQLSQEYLSQVIISHNAEFISTLCQWHLILVQLYSFFSGPEIWNIEAGRMTHKGKAAVVEDAFIDNRSPKGSRANTPARSRIQTPTASVAGTPVGSGDEHQATSQTPAVKKKKKQTRNQLKVQEERRRLRKLKLLTEGGPRPEDTDDEA